ncbi:fused (3R)-hydroxyacyl-ACP dehydratase subunits HadA/HadB [Nocardia stercoris]|uniref:(3R)-hydroxyacyl-ACP dehydratase subunit HadB n=1 Tax=Nocardia stercoris TaxID=2483361 RepID=A0A3M2KZR3_9NOCA|nr:fused (3R)-hydroxyacyl-ACP dehydratase subunits HadA/HadB [Nocardia stercoris]RMI30912.1 (3R)-hydroxyacyl-ACP dehydratase subunit HadB [Nocardia stercoris]
MTINTEIDVEADPAFDPAANAAAHVGHHYCVEDYFEVGREQIREYARSVQDKHPAHWDEAGAAEFGHESLIAPLTFFSKVGIQANMRLFEEIVTGYDLSQIMQTDMVLEFHRPIRVGDRLVSDVYLHSFRQAFGGDILVTRNVVTSGDELVMVAYTTLVGRTSVEVDEKLVSAVNNVLVQGMTGNPRVERPSAPMRAEGAPLVMPVVTAGPGTRAFEDVAVGDELPVSYRSITRGDLVNYAGVSGDGNPIHWSDSIAEMVGLDNVVAHGMLTMGLAAATITSWLGNPGSVKDYSVRFTSPVYVPVDTPAQIEFSGRVKSTDPATRTAVIAITAKSEGRKIFGRATATVQLR